MTIPWLIPVTPGETYTVSAWLKTESAAGATLAATFYDGSFLPSASAQTIGGTADWTLRTVRATAPPGATALRVEYRLFGAGTLWADDLTVVDGTAPVAPANSAPPAVTDQSPGSAGQHTLSASPGTWTGTAPIGYAYQWQRCDVALAVPGGCTDLAGQTGQTMTVSPAPYDTGNYYRAIVRATNSAGGASAGSPGFLLDVPTTNTAKPRVTGVAEPGQTVTATYGSWVGLGRGTSGYSPFSLRWQRCDAAGACTPIVGAQSTGGVGGTTAYTLSVADVGYRIRVMVVATPESSGPSVTAYSEPTEVVAPPTPPNLAPNPALEQEPAASYSTHGAAAFTWASDQSRSPSRSLKIVSAQPEGTLTRWMTIPSLIPVTPGRTYTVSAWLRTESADGATLAATFYDGSFLPSDSTVPLRGTHGWSLQTVRATAPPGATALRVEYRLFGAGTLWADDLTVT
jgi:hypothetical protein